MIQLLSNSVSMYDIKSHVIAVNRPINENNDMFSF